MSKHQASSIFRGLLWAVFVMVGFSSCGPDHWEVNDKENATYILHGLPYEGSFRNKEFGNLIIRMEDLAKAKKDSIPTAVFYYEELQEDDQIRSFVGLLLEDSTTVLDGSFETRVFKFDRIVSGFEVGNEHRSVVYNKVPSYIQQKGWEQDSLQKIEIYLPENKGFYLDVPVVKRDSL